MCLAKHGGFLPGRQAGVSFFAHSMRENVARIMAFSVLCYSVSREGTRFFPLICMPGREIKPSGQNVVDLPVISVDQ